MSHNHQVVDLFTQTPVELVAPPFQGAQGGFSARSALDLLFLDYAMSFSFRWFHCFWNAFFQFAKVVNFSMCQLVKKGSFALRAKGEFKFPFFKKGWPKAGVVILNFEI
jgi:hypothetical protein